MRASMIALALACSANACGEDPESCPEGTCPTGSASWLTDSCSSLGGTEIASGGCHRACKVPTDCPGGSTCTNQNHQPYCRIDRCNSASECGTKGWVCSYGACYLACAAHQPGVQAPDCPTGFQCSYGGSISSQPTTCTKIVKQSCGTCKTCYSSCSSSCGPTSPGSCVTTCMANCDKCCV